MYYNKLLARLKACAALSVPISTYDRIKYGDLFEQNPAAFNYNATKEFYTCMKQYIYEGKKWCINLAGKTRHGKSEVAQTWTMLYIDMFNIALNAGAYNSHKLQGIKYNMAVLPLLNADDILFSQSNFLYYLREDQVKNKLIYGKPHIVDEDQDKTGGLGSYSEKLEIDNVNNITAQALQAEWQLRPDKFVLVNAPYGLFQDKMDIKNKVNWSILYEQRNDPTRTRQFVFKGWVATPLHHDAELRKQYNRRKQKNIIDVLEGKGDLRLLERQKVAKLLAVDSDFNKRTVNNKAFKYSIHQQTSILNEWITDGKIQNFNSLEKDEIVSYARMLAEKKHEAQACNERKGKT